MASFLETEEQSTHIFKLHRLSHWYGLHNKTTCKLGGGTTNYKEKNFGGLFGQRYCPCRGFSLPALETITFLSANYEDSNCIHGTQVQGSLIKVRLQKCFRFLHKYQTMNLTKMLIIKSTNHINVGT